MFLTCHVRVSEWTKWLRTKWLWVRVPLQCGVVFDRAGFSGKNSTWQKKTFCNRFLLKKFLAIIYLLVQNLCLGKFFFFSLGTIYPEPIRLQGSLKNTLSDWIIGFLWFFTLLHIVKRGKYLDQCLS